MSDYAIKVENLSKEFKLPHNKKTSLKEAAISLVKRDNNYEVQSALNDVSFEIKKGEFFGIVGRNGSGKSTLLKIMAGVYTPTSGGVKVNGSLVPFIELGVGFNPELSGRDNVFLNGSLLGFSRKEITDLYEDIVDFAELERFMDQKLKNYSSGMQVRLAFSIAIKARGNILLLDEVLAVGDDAFKRKCYNYFETMKSDASQTVVLVTHSMSIIQQYCDRALILKDGQVLEEGSSEKVTARYSLENLPRKDSNNQEGATEVDIRGIRVNGDKEAVVEHKEDMDIRFEVTPLNRLKGSATISIINSDGMHIADYSTRQQLDSLDIKEGETKRLQCHISGGQIGPGAYGIDVTFHDEQNSIVARRSRGASFAVQKAVEKKKKKEIISSGDWKII